MIFSLLISLVLISIVMSDKPKLAGRLPTVLPPKMTSNKIGTWAHSTMSKRLK